MAAPPFDRSAEDAGAQFGPTSLVTLQDGTHVGYESVIGSIFRPAEQHLARLDGRRRETRPVSDLVVGLQCGGSDALSGFTAKPALGHAADPIVRAGRVISADETLESMGQFMLEKTLAVTCREKPCSKRLGISDQLALFNPGPVT